MIKNKGYLIFVQSNKSTDYFKQAVALSMSIKLHNKNANVCLMTNISVPDDLKKYFSSMLSDTKQIVHMCGSGVTACHNIIAMEHAGIEGSKLYAGSWSEWITVDTRAIVLGK